MAATSSSMRPRTRSLPRIPKTTEPAFVHSAGLGNLFFHRVKYVSDPLTTLALMASFASGMAWAPFGIGRGPAAASADAAPLRPQPLHRRPPKPSTTLSVSRDSGAGPGFLG